MYNDFIKFVKANKTLVYCILIIFLVGCSSTNFFAFILAIVLLFLILKLEPSTPSSSVHVRVGLGYDVHKLEKNKPLILCGTTINHTKGLVSFSDGDVATHALIDALLGASNLGDIGALFPDNNPKFKNISSLSLLQQTTSLLKKNGFKVLQVDLTIVAQKPILQPFVGVMKTNLNSILMLAPFNLNIKATTEEGLGFTGAEEGIKAICVATISAEAKKQP